LFTSVIRASELHVGAVLAADILGVVGHESADEGAGVKCDGLEVLAANGSVTVVIGEGGERPIVAFGEGRNLGLAFSLTRRRGAT